MTLPYPHPANEVTTKVMKANKSKDTKPEVALRKALREAGYPGYRLHWKKAPGHPDIAYPGRKVAIFVNGCFWHRCPYCNPSFPKHNHEYWESKFQRNLERDKRVVQELESTNWTVIVVWECEIRTNLDGVVAMIESKLVSKF